MAMNQMMKLQKSIKASERRVQKRRDVQDERNAGAYINGVNAYLDKDDHPLDGVEIPHWFKNLSKAWQTNRILGAQRRREKLAPLESTRTVTGDWNQWCDDRVDMLGEDCDPRTQKPKAGRPRLPDYLKKNPTKIKRSDAMKVLLLNNGISLDADDTLRGRNGLYIGWKFQINGRVRFENEDPISVHRFLTLI